MGNSNRARLRSILALIVLLAAAEPRPATAQPATPTAGGITLVASGLANPRGFTWGEDGTLFVALAGTGETATSVGPASSVVKIENGCPTGVAAGLPSTFDPFRDVLGPFDVAFRDGQLYVLQGATSPEKVDNPTFPNGLYAVEADGAFRLVADLTAWIYRDPVAEVPGDLNPLGEPVAMISDRDGFWVLMANTGEVLRITPDGKISRLADLSKGHPVPVGFAAAPSGGVYVGYLTPAPHADGSSKIIKVTVDGQVSDVWTGLTTVTGIAVEPDGTLLALEMATGITIEGGMTPGTGRIVRQTGPASLAEVVTGLDYPIAMRFGPDGGLYVGFPAYGAGDLDGAIIRIDPSQPRPLAMDAALLEGSTCAAIQRLPSPPAAPAATPVATPVLADLTPQSGQIAVEIHNFAYVPPALALELGATITWTNRDSSPHTATGTTDGSFNSGNLDQGQTFSYTFNRAGEYPYVCLYHPYMTGTIVVK